MKAVFLLTCFIQQFTELVIYTYDNSDKVSHWNRWWFKKKREVFLGSSFSMFLFFDFAKGEDQMKAVFLLTCFICHYTELIWYMKHHMSSDIASHWKSFLFKWREKNSSPLFFPCFFSLNNTELWLGLDWASIESFCYLNQFVWWYQEHSLLLQFWFSPSLMLCLPNNQPNDVL